MGASMPAAARPATPLRSQSSIAEQTSAAQMDRSRFPAQSSPVPNAAIGAHPIAKPSSPAWQSSQQQQQPLQQSAFGMQQAAPLNRASTLPPAGASWFGREQGASPPPQQQQQPPQSMVGQPQPVSMQQFQQAGPSGVCPQPTQLYQQPGQFYNQQTSTQPALARASTGGFFNQRVTIITATPYSGAGFGQIAARRG